MNRVLCFAFFVVAGFVFKTYRSLVFFQYVLLFKKKTISLTSNIFGGVEGDPQIIQDLGFETIPHIDYCTFPILLLYLLKT